MTISVRPQCLAWKQVLVAVNVNKNLEYFVSRLNVAVSPVLTVVRILYVSDGNTQLGETAFVTTRLTLYLDTPVLVSVPLVVLIVTEAAALLIVTRCTLTLAWE